MKTTGLIVDVLRHVEASGPHSVRISDCTRDGLSSRHISFTVLDDAVEGPFEPSENRPALRIVRRKLFGEVYMHLAPADCVNEKGEQVKHTSFGGNFAFTSDSRFRKVASYPLPIHDRVE